MANRNKTGVTYLDKKIFANSKKNNVTCKLVYGINVTNVPCIEQIIHSTNKLASLIFNTGCNIEQWYDENMEEQTYFTWECKGVATCDPEDRFDKNLGSKIAMTRAQKIAFKQASRFYNKVFNLVMPDMERLVKMKNASQASYTNCKNHVNELIEQYF